MRCIANALGIVALVVSVSSLGCAVEDPDAHDQKTEEKAKEKESAIYGGSADSSDDAVVFLYSNAGYACSGTIVATNGNTGYVLTAGHCAGMDYIFQADNLTACLNNDQCENFWYVDDQVVHPMFNENQIDNGHDFSMIRFTFDATSTPPTPVPAAASPDGVQEGSQVNLVGYGLTQNGDADFRMHVNMPVDTLYSNFLGFDQSGGQGTCQGDSGGPAIFNGKVVGVTSFGGQSCSGPGAYGYSGRVSNDYNTFIAPYIGAPVVETCETCASAAQNGACSSQADACGSNDECVALNNCLVDCTTQACYDGCYSAHPNGASTFDTFIGCLCDACSICMCGSSTTVTSVTTTGPTVTTGAGGASSAGGGTPSTNNGGANNGGQSSEGGGDAVEDGGNDEGCGCAVAGREDASQSPWLGALAIVFGVGAASRRRRRAA